MLNHSIKLKSIVKNIYRTLLITIFSLLALNSCMENGENASGSDLNAYYINIGDFTTLNSAKNFRLGLVKEINEHAHIQKISDRAYKVLVGKYKTSYEAGKDAYKFLSGNFIKSYSIIKNSKEVLDEFRNILFTADYQGRPSVYQFDILSKKSVIIWSRWGSKVVSLNVSDNRKIAFITSVLTYGKKSGLAYIMDSRIFLLDREKNEYFEKYQFGDGVQLYTYWENPDTFKLNITSIDTINSRIIYQKIYSLDLNGKVENIFTRDYDLIKNGFPLPPKRTPVYISPNNRFQFRQSEFNDEYDIYLKDIQEKSEVLVASTKRKIADARWSEDGNYLFIVTGNLAQNIGKKKTQQLTGELIIIDAVQKKQVNLFSGFRYRNILVQGDLLFFDERLDGSSKINILDYRQNKIYYTITMPGGCGLNNLPM